MAVDMAAVKADNRTRVLELLESPRHSWKTRRQIERAGGNRYGARLHELKRLGYLIESRGNAYGPDGKEYKLTGKGEPIPKMVRVYMTEADAIELEAGRTTTKAQASVASGLRKFRNHRNNL